jgi:hypothetical protein
MLLELNDKEKDLLKHVLEVYFWEMIADWETIEEVVRAEAFKWRPPRHEVEDAIKKLIQRLS